MRIGLFSSVKDEGPFILEWVAYHILSGFDPIVVFSNDSTDGTTELLSALDHSGIVSHVLQNLEPGQIPQYTAAEKAFHHPALERVEWLMWLDIDEYLLCLNPDNSVADLIVRVDGIADGIAVNWLNFGNGGYKTWEPGLITQRFVLRGVETNSRHSMFKTLFRKTDRIRGFGLHRPFVRGDFQSTGSRFVNAAGVPMHDDMYRSGRLRRHALGSAPEGLVAHDWAAIFHYAVKTRDSFEVKRSRGQGTKPMNADNRSSRFREAYWNIYNQNEVKDERMLEHGDDLARKVSELLSIPGVLRAHNACLDHYRRRLMAAGVR